MQMQKRMPEKLRGVRVLHVCVWKKSCNKLNINNSAQVPLYDQ